MKKLLGCFLCVMLLVFGSALIVQALPIPPEYVGGTTECTDCGDPPGAHMDTLHNVNFVLDAYNDLHVGDELPSPITEGSKTEIEGEGPISGTITFDGGYDYLSLKYSTVFDLWWIDGASSFSISDNYSPFFGEGELTNALSHYTLWNPSSVPEPATMFLLGTGLIGLALFGRQRFKK